MGVTALVGAVLALAGGLAALVDAIWVLTRAEMSSTELLVMLVSVAAAAVGSLMLAVPLLLESRRAQA